jgi:tetratricopeptide (TPR) repeat protein
MKIAGIILLFPLTSMLITEFKSSGYERSAVVYSKKHPELAAVLFDKAVESKHDRPGVIYKAAVHFYYEMDNPELALKYFSMISENTPFKNYAHNNGFTGIILFEKGRYGEALKYFRRETENYPVSAVARYYIYLCFLKMNMKKEAELTFSHLLAILKHKGLTFKDMPELMKNPVYDSKPFLLIEAKKKGKPENDRKTH